MSLTDADRAVIAEADRVGPALRASSSDRDRLAGWVIRELTAIISRQDAAVEAVLELHSRWEIRGGDDGEGEFEQAVCRHCCAADGGGQTEDCAVTHMPDECWPCPTCRVITAALTGQIHEQAAIIARLEGDTAALSLQVQITALIVTWQREKAERYDLADGMFTDGNKSYQQGYGDALDRCVQALKLLRD